MYLRRQLASQHRRRCANKLGGTIGAGHVGIFECLEPRFLLTIDDPVTSALTQLTTISNAASNSTAKEQAQVWQHGGHWWGVLNTTNNTSVYRLDGASWTSVITISNSKAYNSDVKPVGNGDTVYVFLDSFTTSRLAKLTYSSGVYQLASLPGPQSPLAAVPLTAGSDRGTIDIDSTGRMWVASDTTSTIEVRWSDAPYTTWSSPITLATGMTTAGELSGVIAFGGKIGVLWTNHNTERFGFRYHVDGDDPNTWSADEVPASQSAQAIGHGMADDHLSIVADADGTVYAAVKTAYDVGTQARPEMALLVRRPNGQWDPLYGIDGHGTRPVLVLNSAKGFLRYIYAGETGVNDIVYKDIRLSAINAALPNKFYSGDDVSNPTYPRQTLISGGLSKNVTTTKGPFDGELVILWTNASGGAYTTGNGTAPYFIGGVKMVDTLVLGSHRLFYAGSPLDVDNGNGQFSDDNAIALDKVALLPGGGMSRFVNVSSYQYGITGIMIDLTGTHGTITASDFTFRVGTTNDPNGTDSGTPWTTVATAPTVLVRAGAGNGGGDRVELIWPNNTIKNTFLEVTMKANTHTGLASPDIFYFGSLVGDSGLGNDVDVCFTDSIDIIAARANQASDLGDITNRFDYNRDDNVDATDILVARANNGELPMISINDPPHAPSSGGGAAGAVASSLASAAAAPLGSASTAPVLVVVQSQSSPADFNRVWILDVIAQSSRERVLALHHDFLADAIEPDDELLDRLVGKLRR